MNPSSEPTDAQAAASPIPGPSEVLPGRNADRRRLLLKGVGRGSALLGAAVPLKTLATQKIITLDSTQCTVSGMQSGVHSASPGSPICNGFSVSVWGQSVLNLGLTPSKTWPTGVNYNAQCKTVFSRCTLEVTSGSTKQPATLFQVVNRFPTSDDAHWVCAWLNSKIAASLNFPYTSDMVVDHYNKSNPNALLFYKKYTETKSS